MAEDRSEDPTPKRREESRKRGQTARSQDLTSAVVLLAGLYGIKILAGGLKDRLSALLVGNLLAIGAPVDPDSAALNAGTSAIGTLVDTLPPLLGMLVAAALAVSVLQGGFMFVPGLLTPKLERVNLIAGTKKILSMQGLIRLGQSLAKLAVIAGITAMTIHSHLEELAGLGTVDLMTAVSRLLSLIWEVLFRGALALLGLAILDWVMQRRRHLQSIRMTKKEVTDENRQSEGDPHVRAQLRGKRQQFLQQMMQDVKTADVVVTNPTHFAVALKYDPTGAGAPTVIAKGQDHLALRLREAAAEARIPVMQNPPLARALYKLVPVGREIPPELFVAVAEVLAFVYRLKMGQRAA